MNIKNKKIKEVLKQTKGSIFKYLEQKKKNRKKKKLNLLVRQYQLYPTYILDHQLSLDDDN
jgi:hypothetical protein